MTWDYRMAVNLNNHHSRDWEKAKCAVCVAAKQPDDANFAYKIRMMGKQSGSDSEA